PAQPMTAAHHSFFQTPPSPVPFGIRDLRAAVSVCVASTRRSRASSRLGNDQLFSMLQSGDGCLARHRRKLFQKLDERVSAFQIIEQILERRSEEHTSELQSPYDLVCRLLLEKKNEYLKRIK